MFAYTSHLLELFLITANRNPNKTALICDNKHVSYGELQHSIIRFSQYLLQVGIIKGDRITICLDNSMAAVICFWSSIAIGAIPSILHAEITDAKLIYILQDAEPSLLVHARSESSENFALYTKRQLLIENVNWEAHLNFENKNILPPQILDIDLASIIYTSGSTGEAKGVMLSHRNMLAAIYAVNAYLQYRENDVVISVLPLAFDYGLYQMLLTFAVGATLILEQNFLWPGQILKLIRAYKVTILPLVPSMIPPLYKLQTQFQYDLTSLRMMTNTGAALNKKNIEMLQLLHGAAEIFSMYGLTECKRCTYLPPAKIMSKPESVGIAIPNTELWLEDESGNRVSAGQIGQLVIRSATVMLGYWRKPIETAAKLKHGNVPGESVLHTGDYCWQDTDGYLYFHSRMDEMVKIKGMKVSLKEIEALLMEKLAIREVCVLAKKMHDQDILLYGFISADEFISTYELKQQINQHFPPHYHLYALHVLPTLPKNANGKINKMVLEEYLS